jgi:fructokinase
MVESHTISSIADEKPILCAGEALVDLMATPADSWAEIDRFVPRIGGAPANAAVAIQRLGGKGAFFGCLADDDPGRWIHQRLSAESVDLSRVVYVKDAQTRLAIVTGPEDQRDFVFYGSPPADSLLRIEHIDDARIERASAIMVGSLLLLSEPGRSAMYRLLDLAIQHKIPITFDPNPRPKSWPDPGDARKLLLPFIRVAKILKLGADEPAILGMTPEQIREEQPEGSVFVLTDGANGCLYWYGEEDSREVPAIPVNSVDATGAGDCFAAALTLRAVERGYGINVEDVRFASAAGALATTQLGAMDAIPDRAAVEQMMKE